MMLCSKCNNHASYDSPELLCEEHWIEWWVDGFYPRDGSQARLNYINEIKESINKSPLKS